MRTAFYLLLALGSYLVPNCSALAPKPAPKVVQAAQDPPASEQGKVFEEWGYFFVEQMPVFQGGTASLSQYVADHIQYPAPAKEKKIAGTVTVCFMVGPKGKVERASVVKSRHPLLDAEALRVISTMPAWQPGRHNGRVVTVSMIVPVEFKLK